MNISILNILKEKTGVELAATLFNVYASISEVQKIFENQNLRRVGCLPSTRTRDVPL